MAKAVRRTAAVPVVEIDAKEFMDLEAAFAPTTEAKITALSQGELTAGAGLSALTLLLGEAIQAEKIKMDRIKVMDKLLNTGKAFLEAKIKCEEVSLLTERLDRLEKFMAERMKASW
jgi:hypothetical protein